MRRGKILKTQNRMEAPRYGVIGMMRLFFALLVLLPASPGQAAESNRWTCVPDVEFARAGERALNLDLYVPAGKARSPLIVWVHGGAWRSGSRKAMPLTKLVEDGYSVASVDYRLSTEAKFP